MPVVEVPEILRVLLKKTGMAVAAYRMADQGWTLNGVANTQSLASVRYLFIGSEVPNPT